jgi:EmrB/QacA subfamily drug resistance transporter
MRTLPMIPPRPSTQRRGAILAIVLVAYFMVVLDNSIVFTGLPSIQRELSFTNAGLSWVQNAYALMFGGLLLLGARAGDILGRRRMLFIGLAVFTIASLAVSLAPTAEFLLAARAVQGIGSAILAPTTLSLLTANFPEGHERTRAVAAYGSIAGVGASVGLVVGGVLASTISWRAGFFVNVPIGILMTVAAIRFVRETPRASARFDAIGAVLSTVGMTSLVFGIVTSADAGWTSAVTIATVTAGLALLAGFVVSERRAAQPIMPLRLFASRVRSGAYGARMLFLGAMMGFFFFTTQYLQGVLHFTALQAGLGFLPMTVVNFGVALAVPRLTRRLGNGVLLAAGVAVTAAGMFWLSRVGVGSDYLSSVALPMVLIGAGQGLAFAPLTSAGLTGVAESDSGAASGLINTAHQLGGSLGLGILVALAAGIHGTTPAGIAARTSLALTGGGVLLAAGLIVVVVCGARRPRQGRSGAHADPDFAQCRAPQTE